MVENESTPESDETLLAILATQLSDDRREPSEERVTILRAEFEASRQEALPSGETARRLWQGRLSVAVLGLAAAAILIIGFVLGRGFDERAPTPSESAIEFIEVLRDPDGPATADVTGLRTGIGRVIQIRTDELPILPKGDFYEVWFVGPGDSPSSPNRISAGTFHPDSNGATTVDLAAAVDPSLFPILLITVEPGDGDPSASHVEALRTEIEIIG